MDHHRYSEVFVLAVFAFLIMAVFGSCGSGGSSGGSSNTGTISGQVKVDGQN